MEYTIDGFPLRENVSHQSNQFSAGPIALGYLYQCRLALWYSLVHLRDGDDAEIAIESLDDVVFSTNGEPLQLLQTKHHLNAKASLADSSADLWKTLRIWSSQIDLVKNGARLYLITTAVASPGTVAHLLRAGAGRDIDAARKRLAAVVATSVNDGNSVAYQAFNSLTPDDQAKLLEAVTVIDGSPNVLDVRKAIERELRLTVRPNCLAPFTDRLEGWWYARVVCNLARRDDGFVLSREIRSQIDDFRDQFQQDNLPVDFESVFPGDDVIKAMLGKPFVEQLRLIALTDARIRYAVVDYYRAFEQRSRWLREDLLLVGDLDSYERRLVEEWERAFERIRQSHKVSNEAMKATAGRAVFDWAQEANIFIRPQCQQPYIHRGSFQILADKMKVGWHPEFLARLESILSPIGGTA
jgi:hypothetical protein